MDKVKFDHTSILKDYQVKIVEEVYTKFMSKDRENQNIKGTVIAAKMGKGKTLMSLVLALMNGNKNGTLIVCTKSLLSNFCSEIDKFFNHKKSKNKKTYFVAHNGYNKGFTSDDVYGYDFVITTKEVMSSGYSDDIDEWFVQKEEIAVEGTNLKTNTSFFSYSPKAFEDEESFIFNRKWSNVIIDEIHIFLNLTTKQSKAMCCIPAKHKIGLSGTLFKNPTAENILALMLFIENTNWVNNIKQTKNIIEGKDKVFPYSGIGEFIVQSLEEEESEEVINFTTHYNFIEMSELEKKVYDTIAKFMSKQVKKKESLKEIGDKSGNVKKLSNFILVLVTYVKQCLVNPIIVVSTIYLQKISGELSDLGVLLDKLFLKEDIYRMYEPKETIISNRMRETISIAMRRKKVIIFSYFRTVLDLIAFALKKTKKRVDTIESDTDRGELIDEIKDEEENILLLTYKIGSVGLNLQFMDTVIFIDYDYDSSATNQARARVIRPGQTQDVEIYYMVSNTYLEDRILSKHIDKEKRGKEVMVGKIKTKVNKISAEQMATYIDKENNVKVFGESLTVKDVPNSIVTYKNKEDYLDVKDAKISDISVKSLSTNKNKNIDFSDSDTDSDSGSEND